MGITTRHGTSLKKKESRERLKLSPGGGKRWPPAEGAGGGGRDAWPCVSQTPGEAERRRPGVPKVGKQLHQGRRNTADERVGEEAGNVVADGQAV